MYIDILGTTLVLLEELVVELMPNLSHNIINYFVKYHTREYPHM